MLFLVRALARESTNGEGARFAEYTRVVLYAVANWLRQEGLIPDTAALPRPGWKVKTESEAA
jgi:hypothetical protein